jgi:hypothetical protein
MAWWFSRHRQSRNPTILIWSIQFSKIPVAGKAYVSHSPTALIGSIPRYALAEISAHRLIG